MKRLNKLAAIVLAASFSLALLAGCGEQAAAPDENVLTERTEYIEPIKAVTVGSKTYLAGNGVPYMRIGAHLRLDQMILGDGLKAKDAEPYFVLAKEQGLDVLELPVMWSTVETERGKYSFDELKAYLALAKKHSLKINLLWYGSLTDGQSHTAYYPGYVSSDPEAFTVIKDILDYGIYGRMRVLKWDDPDLLHWEGLALYNTMNAVYDFATAENYNPVAEVQLGYGADRFAKWRIEQYDVQVDGVKMSDTAAAEMINAYLNAMGKAVKYSSYRALTRVEFCEQTAVTNSVVGVYNLEYVDLVTPTYLHVIANAKTGIGGFASDSRLSSMPVINTENYASDSGARNLLATYALGGCGYSAYYLSAPVYYPESPTGALYGRIKADGSFDERGTRATEFKAVSELLRKASYAVLTTSPEDFATLGMDNRVEDGGTQKTYFRNGIAFSYTAQDADAPGYVLCAEGCIYVASLTDADITFERTALTVANCGTMNATGEWTKIADADLTSNNTTLHLEAGKLYRVRYSSAEPMTNDWIRDNRAYSSVKDSLRG